MQTTTTNHRTYPQFTSLGNGYDTMAGVMARIAQLSYINHVTGPSDGRVTELNLLYEDLEAFAANITSISGLASAEDPQDAVRMALETGALVYGYTQTPILTVLEEMEIAACNSNMHRRNKCLGLDPFGRG